jgi:hypothetical protein
MLVSACGGLYNKILCEKASARFEQCVYRNSRGFQYFRFSKPKSFLEKNLVKLSYEIKKQQCRGLCDCLPVFIYKNVHTVRVHAAAAINISAAITVEAAL